MSRNFQIHGSNCDILGSLRPHMITAIIHIDYSI